MRKLPVSEIQEVTLISFQRLFSTLYTCPRDRVRGVKIDLGKTEARLTREPYQGALRAPVNQKLSSVGNLARKYLRFRVSPGVENAVFGENPVVVYSRKIYDYLCTISSVDHDNCKKDAWRRLNAASQNFPEKKISCEVVRGARLNEVSASRVLLSFGNQFSPSSHKWVVARVSIGKRPFEANSDHFRYLENRKFPHFRSNFFGLLVL